MGPGPAPLGPNPTTEQVDEIIQAMGEPDEIRRTMGFPLPSPAPAGPARPVGAGALVVAIIATVMILLPPVGLLMGIGASVAAGLSLRRLRRGGQDPGRWQVVLFLGLAAAITSALLMLGVIAWLVPAGTEIPSVTVTDGLAPLA